MGKHRPGVKVVGLAALATAINGEPTALRLSKPISVIPTRLAAGTMKVVGVKVLLKPLLAWLFV
jgi:hypothetical protein